MSAHDHHEPAPGAKYEVTDANIMGVAKTGIVVFVTVFGAMLLMWGLHVGFEKTPVVVETTPMETGRALPPLPHLQVNQQKDLADFRARETSILTTYGKLPSGGVRMPIDRAIQLLSERGGLIAEAGATPVAAAPKAERKAEAGKKKAAKKE